MKDKTSRSIVVQGTPVTITSRHAHDYISLTDMVKRFGDETVLYAWLRNRNTLEFLGIWERIHNPGFNPIEFERFRSQAGLNSFSLSPTKWVQATNAIGLFAKAGRGGGTFAHRDILEHLIPAELTKAQIQYVYASEADLLNVALFGKTAADWRSANPTLAGNLRDHASLEQLVVLSNLESLNSVLIHQGLAAPERLQQLNAIAIVQIRSLLASTTAKQLSGPGKKR